MSLEYVYVYVKFTELTSKVAHTIQVDVMRKHISSINWSGVEAKQRVRKKRRDSVPNVNGDIFFVACFSV